jgi:hypothetical protein
MGFSDRWLNQNSQTKNTCTISTIGVSAGGIVDIVQGFQESEIEMAEYPQMAPCPLRGGHWVYRGQACEMCGKRPGCPSWDVKTFTPRTDLPAGIVKLRRSDK